MNRKLVFIICLTFCFLHPSLGGETERFDNLDGHNGYWIGAGIGTNYFGVTKSVNISIALEQHIFSFRYAKSDEFQFNVEGIYDEPTLGMKEFSLLYGRYFKKDNFALTFSFGISYVHGINRGSHIEFRSFETHRISTMGVPLGFEFMIGLSENIGIALHCTGNLNTDKIFGGASAKINVGLF